MTINAFDTVQQIFDEFVDIKDIPKTVALNDMLELYMLSEDEDLYFKLKKKYLDVEGVKQMILDKDSNNDIRSTESFIFMKLGNTTDVNGNDYDGHETIATYISDEKTRGYTWFSTQSLYYGMSQKRVENYNNSMVAGNKVTILFCFGENAGGKNDIAYTADVMEIVSYKIPTVFPTDDYPEDLRFCYHLHKVNRILRIYSVSMKPPGINSSIRNHNEIWIFSFCHILNSKHTQL